jgi:hypothetical protein
MFRMRAGFVAAGLLAVAALAAAPHQARAQEGPQSLDYDNAPSRSGYTYVREV